MWWGGWRDGGGDGNEWVGVWDRGGGAMHQLNTAKHTPLLSRGDITRANTRKKYIKYLYSYLCRNICCRVSGFLLLRCIASGCSEE